MEEIKSCTKLTNEEIVEFHKNMANSDDFVVTDNNNCVTHLTNKEELLEKLGKKINEMKWPNITHQGGGLFRYESSDGFVVYGGEKFFDEMDQQMLDELNVINIVPKELQIELTQDVFDNQPPEVDWCGVDYDGSLNFGRAINPRYTDASERWRGFEQIGEPVKYTSYKTLTSLRRKKKYNVITLCGSTKFQKEFMEVQKMLTLEGNIVISVGVFGHSDPEFLVGLNDEVKKELDNIHLAKIDMSDEIFVINVGGYIGNSTNAEINYAILNNKKITYLEPIGL